ncbi:C-terminal binding protein [Prosthecomicrobium pneumaticum]|uniref:D-3-phosphoglycerate dehydrogenase n=1 Tax=Prosthecomicrobium pneumaticum TaxID=81895 RepID=A0A7W9L400_9HYPH|nr:C-terminal binding protein [Prosthecomicrobium pneumaticum]MBB5755076.1 D-3-phosphoglycerate dehydrogenase [Prosthecomicrobium pneumaticum]
MARKPKVVITDYDYGDVDIERGILEAAGAEVIALQAKREDDLLAAAADCDAIMNQYARVGARTIAAMERCRVIARYGVGVDIVDVAAASAKGILVTNVRDYCTDEVADHAVSLWLALARRLFDYDRATHQGIWRWQSGSPIHRLRGRTLGIVSFGKIGQAIANRARPFGVTLIAYDPYLPAEVAKAHDIRQVDKATLLAEADVVMMQVPMTDETRHFLGEAEFAAMKPGALVINTGRGPTIDNKALYRALVEGRIAGAGLDDPEEEPAKLAAWSPDDNPIFSLSNVIVTPHAAYYSEESIRTARETAASEVARVLTGQQPRNPVNAHLLTVAQGKLHA